MNLFKRFFGPKGPPSPDDNARALLKAARLGNLEQVCAQLERGTDVNVTDKQNCTPLILAAWNGHLGVVRCLLDKGANVNARTKSGNTALMVAIGAHKVDIASTLLTDGLADVNLQDANGRTALMVAAWHGASSLVTDLISKGAEVNAALSKDISVNTGRGGLAPVW